ncbi:hypothetical protein PVAP13_2KG042500 [Panicum virgatum]|uniref:DUF4220 domain-containing protein n=2 Tax=Panicum virgatum TaxID=38727 RepID=A0A8T0W1I2_PANVG|nr:hypothetical protein PVAP13_2KG042500 [Panicum virgatum]
MGEKMWQVNTLILINAIFAGVIVVIGAYAQRYRHHLLARFIFLGATTLFLPIISYVVSTIDTNTNDYIREGKQHDFSTLAATCHGGFHQYAVVSWAFLVQIVVVNTSVVVAVDDREGRNKGPPIGLFAQGIWTLYLGVSTMGPIEDNMWPFHLEFMLFTIFCAKIVLKFYAFVKARQSLAFGRNPPLIFGYMKQLQLQEASQLGEPLAGEDDAPPAPLLVMGEEAMQVEKQPHGYVCMDVSRTTIVNSTGLVTFDKVWQLDDMLAISRPQVKDICLSFALFKLLRCRFARYKLANAGSIKTLNFFWSLLLKEGEHARIFRVITDELSFVQDYHFSSLPVSYSKYWLPVLSVSISLLSICYCLVAASFIIKGLLFHWEPKYKHQMRCDYWCSTERQWISTTQSKHFGFFLFDDVPLFFLLALVVIAEVRYIASYIYSNWTKVALICHYINHASLQHSLCMQKWFGLLLKRKCEMMKHWDEKIGQSTILVVHPRITPLLVLRRLLGLPDLDRSVKIPEAVKVCIIRTMRRYRFNGRQLSNGIEFLRQSGVDERFSWACSSNSTSVTILTWHIATCIHELRHPYHYQHGREQGFRYDLVDHKIIATHLSRYCAYLMAWSPELLPDDKEWSMSLYEIIKKDAKRALAAAGCTAGGSLTPEAEYEQVIQLLSVNSSMHDVLRNGMMLGKQLVELIEGEETAWMVLAGFWSEMILYIAPSDNVRDHLEAIARGGELITLLWALLTHAGIMSRPGIATADDDGDV